MRRVLLRHGREFESQTVTRPNMAHDRLGPDLAFLDKKIEPGFRAHGPRTWGSKKQASRAQVQDAGNVIPTMTTPIDPDTIRRFDARGMAPRVGRCLRREGHKAPWALPDCKTSDGDVQGVARFVENYAQNLWKTREKFCQMAFDRPFILQERAGMAPARSGARYIVPLQERLGCPIG
jgi:hypothetical protein